ncbi:lamin tail domain-containing protein [Chloroflexi bacterium TSY]|nr:lamin tail domain-containing protein [Chloroflexi bacterium TSY]
MYTSLRGSEKTDKTEKAEKRTRHYEDKSDFLELLAGISMRDEGRDRFLFDHINIPAAINYLAVTTIIHDNDHIAKNYYLYRDSNGTREWTMLPWDKDLTFGRNFTGDFRYLTDSIWSNEDPFSHPLFGDSNHRKVDGQYNLLIDVLYEDDRIREMYGRRLRTLMEQLLQPPGTPESERRYERRIEELYQLLRPDVELDRKRWKLEWGGQQKFRKALDIVKRHYLDNRRIHLFFEHGPPGGPIPAPQPTNIVLRFGPYELDYSSPAQLNEYFSLVNPHPFAVDISGWTIAGNVSYTFQPGVVIPSGDTLYLSPDVTAFRRRPNSPKGREARFVQGDYHSRLSRNPGSIQLLEPSGNLVTEFTYEIPRSPQAGRLVVSELNYHPPRSGNIDGDLFEFIELHNVGPKTIPLGGYAFIDGIDYVFPQSAVLHPGDFVVVARDIEVFATRYSGVRVLGGYEKKLSNRGERLTLVDALGMRVFSFVYADLGLWPSEADGEGATLVRANRATRASDPCAWQASMNPFGSPGAPDPPGGTTKCPERLYLPIFGD